MLRVLQVAELVTQAPEHVGNSSTRLVIVNSMRFAGIPLAKLSLLCLAPDSQ